MDVQAKPPKTQCRDRGRQGSASNPEKFLSGDTIHEDHRALSPEMLTHKSIPISFWPWTRGCWHCLQRSCRAAGCTAILQHDTVPLLCTTSSAGSSRGFCVLCSRRGTFGCPFSADCVATALLHGQPWLQGIILLAGGDAGTHLNLPFVQCPGFCKAEGELYQNQPSSSSSPNDEFLCCYLQEECMGREMMIFNVCFNVDCICPSIFLHFLILYFCNYFPISIDSIMALLLVTFLLLPYFSSSGNSLKRGTNMCFNITVAQHLGHLFQTK